MDAVHFLSTFMFRSDEPWRCCANIKSIESYLGNRVNVSYMNIIGIFNGIYPCIMFIRNVPENRLR